MLQFSPAPLLHGIGKGKPPHHVVQELTLLQEVLSASDLTIAPELWLQLAEINRSLWRNEDDMRDLERIGSFGQTFIRLARSVDRSNDRRAQRKRLISQNESIASVPMDLSSFNLGTVLLAGSGLFCLATLFFGTKGGYYDSDDYDGNGTAH